jgi:hypothetical protein
MGRQLHFYSLEQDRTAILQYAYTIGAVLIPERSKQPWPEIIQDPQTVTERQWQFNSWLLANSSIKFKTEFIHQHQLNRVVEWADVYANPDGVFYAIERLFADVIEFSPSIVRPDGVLSQGRIWAGMNYFEGDTLVDKGEEFRALYDRLTRWFRKNFKRVKGPDGYFGPAAFEWFKNGGKVDGGGIIYYSDIFSKS